MARLDRATRDALRQGAQVIDQKISAMAEHLIDAVDTCDALEAELEAERRARSDDHQQHTTELNQAVHEVDFLKGEVQRLQHERDLSMIERVSVTHAVGAAASAIDSLRQTVDSSTRRDEVTAPPRSRQPASRGDRFDEALGQTAAATNRRNARPAPQEEQQYNHQVEHPEQYDGEGYHEEPNPRHPQDPAPRPRVFLRDRNDDQQR